jgi:hypothetical protein
MSADTFIQAPGNLQSYNRYAYVMNNPLAYTDPSGYWRIKISIGGYTIASISRQTVVRTAALAADVFGGCSGYCSAAVGAHYGAQNGGGLKGAVVGGVTGYFTAQFAGDFGASGYAFSAASGCANAAVAGGDCGRGAAAELIRKGASQIGQETGYQWTAEGAGGCASSRVMGGSCSDGAAAAWGSMATSYVMMGAASELKAAYQRDQDRANSYALAPALIGIGGAVTTNGGGGVVVGGFWTWVVGGGGAAALGDWARRNWDSISSILTANEAANNPPVDGATPGRETKGRTTQWDKGGGFDEANRDFDKLNPGNVRHLPNGGRVGTLPDGREVNVRPDSSSGLPTIEIQDGKSRDKVRYGP